MAKMFPEWINDEQRSNNPHLKAEYKVYDALAEQLSDDWYVFYSYRWTWVKNNTRIGIREADFIIAHHKFGILLLEVKGGDIDVKNGKWVSTDRYKKEHDINPYEQVAQAYHSLVQRLDEERSHPFRGFPISTAVCFPDVDISRKLGKIPQDLLVVTMDTTKLGFLRDNLIKILGGTNEVFSEPGLGRILWLKEFLACSWEIYAPISIQLADIEKETKTLTEKQFKLLYQLAPQSKRLIVSGCSGSGKTLLAAEIARRMVMHEKKKVLFTCFNRNLALWMQRSQYNVNSDDLMIANYHLLCSELARRSGVILPPAPKGTRLETRSYFDEIMPSVLLEAADRLGELYDVIIADEGQDFLPSWWESLLLLLKDNGTIHVYHDPYQRLWGIVEKFPEALTEDAAEIDLNENIRNPKQIYNLSMKFHPTLGEGYHGLNRIGSEPIFITIKDDETEQQTVTKIVHQLVHEDNVSTRDIAILTPLSLIEQNSHWKPGKTKLGKYKLVHEITNVPNEIFCSSIGAAKGLEYPVVILTELYSSAITEEIDDYALHLHVGISRARGHLIIVSSKECFETLYRE